VKRWPPKRLGAVKSALRLTQKSADNVIQEGVVNSIPCTDPQHNNRLTCGSVQHGLSAAV
jgi:hypothetical protein